MPTLTFHPLTSERWSDLETLFGERGAYGGCWCMWWRTTRAAFEQGQGEGNRAALKAIVEAGEVPGILAYQGSDPVAWCSVAPRAAYGSLNRSPVLKPIDETPVWSIVCLFIDKRQRGGGLMKPLIRGAIEYVRQRGGRVIEAYPSLPQRGRMPPVSSFMGIPSVFEALGFVESARPSKSKVILRYTID